VVPGAAGRRGSPELSHSGGDSAGGWVEKVEGLTIDRFVAVDVWGSTGERPAAGAQGGWPRCGSVWQGSGLGGGAVALGKLGRP
jgi:hypothetical protein